ncbi:MAG: DUF72 domain-containing protein [Pseudomonadales bacterium]
MSSECPDRSGGSAPGPGAPALGYRLGLPAWAFPGWRERYFEATPSPLASYAQVFNAVEGNTTFYATPSPATVRSWLAALAGRDFRFCFKLPRTVTHERRPARADLLGLLRALEPLETHLGPLLLQFPARVGPDALDTLRAVFEQLPRGWPAVVEVRHPDFFTGADRLGPLLDEFGYGRAVVDTRALYQGDQSHPDVADAVHEKPDLPVIPEERNALAFVRLVLHPDAPSNAPVVAEWAVRVADYLERGLTPWVMVHCPNDLYCPSFAEAFHAQLADRTVRVARRLPAWPVPQQTGLF